MRHLAILLPLLVLIACTSRQEGGLVEGHKIEAGSRIAVVPIEDAQRHRVRVLRTGQRMTNMVMDALRAQGLDPVLAEPDSIPKDARYVLCGTFLEWEPDLLLLLEATNPATDAVESSVRVAIGSGEIGGHERADMAKVLATAAVQRLLNPAPKSVSAERPLKESRWE